MRYQVSKSQAQAIGDLISEMYGKHAIWLRVDGPIGNSGCIRVRWREGQAPAGGRKGSDEAYSQRLIYLDPFGKPVRWDPLADRPRLTPSGRRIPA